MINRAINIPKSNSFFIFGPRGTGKTTILKDMFNGQNSIYIDLLDQHTFATLQAFPEKLSNLIEPAFKSDKWVIIDEVQKVPQLLDLVHLHIEKDKAKFALTGSSARKLKRGGANLLAGRAFIFNLFPLLALELKEKFNLAEALEWGTLPRIYSLDSSEEKSLFLQAYTETYLQEEIVAEQLIRNLPPFRRFLQISAQMNSAIINYAKIAADVLTDPSNIKNYYQILEDTLCGFMLNPFHLSIRKRQRQSSKFFWFDSGVIRALTQQLDLPLTSGNYAYGKLFETFLINQLRTALSYTKKQFQISYFLTKDGAEVDLIIERAGHPIYLIEIKSGNSVRDSELTNLKKISQDISNSIPLCLYAGNDPLRINNIDVIPWRQGFEYMGIA